MSANQPSEEGDVIVSSPLDSLGEEAATSDPIAEVAKLRRQMWQGKFRPVPLLNGDANHEAAGKKPFGEGWAEGARLNPPKAVTSRPDPDYLNTGILCGEVIAVDIDVDDPSLADAIETTAREMLGNAPTRRRAGSARRAMIYRPASGEPRKQAVTGRAHSKTSACKVEILGHGQQLAAFGFHRSGAFLEWDDGRAPGMGVTLDDLVVITEAQMRDFVVRVAVMLDAATHPNGDLGSPIIPASPIATSAGSTFEASIEDVASALAVIPNDGPPNWEDWKRIAMAAHAATGGSEEGYAAFAAWSAKNPSDDPKETRRAWEEVTRSPPNRIGAGTLFHLAKEADPSWHSPSSRTGGGKQPAKGRNVSHPENFRMTPKGLVHFPPAKGDEEVRELLVAAPFDIVGACRDVDSEGWGIVLRWTDAAGVEHVEIVPRRDLASPQGTVVAQRLEDAGLRCSRFPNLLRSFLIDVTTSRILQSVDKSGWHECAATGWTYVLPTGETLGVSDSDVILKPEIRRIGEEIGIAGTLHEWQTAVAAYAVGNSRLALFLSASLAGVLLDLLTEPSGGFHLVGKSRSGKSTALYMSGSMWGRGPKKTGSWRATTNGLEGMAKIANDGVLLLDEIGQADAREAGDAIYALANGSGKARANVQGAARQRATWRVLYLSTGEIALDVKMAEANRSAATGLQVRLVNIPADAGKGMGVFETLHDQSSPAALADHLRRASDTHYGTAIREFAQQIAMMRSNDEQSLRDLLQHYRGEFSAAHVPQGADGQVTSVAGRFAIVAAAGELGIQLGILPWPKGEATKAAAICFQSWLDQRGHVGAGEDEQVLKHLRGLLVAHGDSRFSDLNSHDYVGNRLGWRRPTAEGPEYLIAKDQWDKEVFRGTNIDPKRALKVLGDAGLLRSDKDRLTLKASHNGTKMNVVCIMSDILSE